jgi:hypothetical protein
MAYPSGTSGIQIIAESDIGENTSHEYIKGKGSQGIIGYSAKRDNRQSGNGGITGTQIPNPGNTNNSHAGRNLKSHNKKKEKEDEEANDTYYNWRHVLTTCLSA